MKVNRGHADYSFEIFFKKFNETLKTHAPTLQEIISPKGKTLKKTLDNHWNIKFFQNKNRIHRKVITAKDPVRKTNLENKYRLYKKQLEKTLKASK